MITCIRRWFPTDLLVAGIVLGLLLGGVHSGYRMIAAHDEREATDAAIAVADRDAQILAGYFQQVQEQVARLHGLARIVSLAQRSGDHLAMERALADLRLAMSNSIPGMRVVAAADTNAEITWDTASGFTGRRDIKNREHATAILRDGKEVFVGEAVSGLLSHEPTIPFAAALRDENGTLIGLTAVAFDPARAMQIARKIADHPNDATTLVRGDGKVLIRSDSHGIGTRIHHRDPSFAPWGDSGIEVARGSSPVDGMPRIAVRQHVPGGDLSVIVGMDEVTALAQVRQDRAGLWDYALLLGAALSLLVAAAFMAWRLYRRNQAQRLYAGSQQARDDLLHEIAGNSPDLIGVIDQDFQYLTVNDASLEILGLPPSVAIGRRVGVHLGSDGTNALEQWLVSVSDTTGNTRLTLPVAHRDGHIVWLELQASRIRLPSVAAGTSDRYPPGERFGWFFVGRDVSARKTAQLALEQANESLSAVVHSAPGALYRAEVPVEGVRRVIFTGTAGPGPGLLGYTSEEWKTHQFADAIIHPDDLPLLLQHRRDLARKGDATAEYRFRRKDGGYVWVRNTGHAVYAPDGSYHVTGYIVDISAEKNQADKLAQAQHLLGLGQLASGLGHELGQPLMVISVAAEVAKSALREGASGIPKAEERLDRIVAMTVRAGMIIDNMHDLARGTSTEVMRVRLPDCLAEAVDMARDQLEAAAVNAIVDVPADLPEVRLKPGLFQQVIVNLIGNACDAYGDTSKDGPRTVRIVGYSAKGQVILRVEDRAGGLPADVIGRVFEPFFTTKGPRGGTGLGLSLCYAIVRQAGGTMSVHNESAGAVFEIVLPIAQPDPPDLTEIPQPAPSCAD